MRLSPASCAAPLKLVNERVTPGVAGEVTAKLCASPYTLASTVAAAALSVLCAPGYDGSGAVLPASGSHAGSPTVFGLPSASASRIAVTGRHSRYAYFAS